MEKGKPWKMRSTWTYAPSINTWTTAAGANHRQIKANLLSNIYLVNSFLDLIRKGKGKKVIFLSSPSGDVEFTRITGSSNMLGYSVSKAALNMAATKFAVELAPEGIKTLSMSPGWVDTDAGQSITKAITVRQQYWQRTAKAVTGDPAVREAVLKAFHKIDPSVDGPIPVAESVSNQLQQVQNLTAKGSGKFVTHRGNENWF
jgi:NAD(P)-dependent dehydrogenase (short-subunit alcohol dehydrogenase family)